MLHRGDSGSYMNGVPMYGCHNLLLYIGDEHAQERYKRFSRHLLTKVNQKSLYLIKHCTKKAYRGTR
jgi:hypothetical protein